MNNDDAIYYIKQLAFLSTEREMPKIEEALKTAIKSLSEDYAKGFQSGYKAKEYDRESDCEGCKFIGLRYIEGAKPRCEGCCRNYADGYVAEQTEPQTCEECEHWNDTEDGCADRHGCKTEPQTYITEDRDTQILDAWQVHHRTSTTAVEDEPQTDCSWK